MRGLETARAGGAADEKSAVRRLDWSKTRRVAEIESSIWLDGEVVNEGLSEQDVACGRCWDGCNWESPEDMATTLARSRSSNIAKLWFILVA